MIDLVYCDAILCEIKINLHFVFVNVVIGQQYVKG